MEVVPAFVDAHQHFWDLGRNPYPWLQDGTPSPFRYGDYSALKRDYLPLDLAVDARGCEPVKTVHVEAEWERSNPVAETRWLEELNTRTGRPDACVAHAALDGENAENILARHGASPLVRGIRHKPTAAATFFDTVRGRPGSMDDEHWRRGYALLGGHGFSFDLQAPWWEFPAARDLAADFPETPIIVNHTGLPADRSADGLAAWRRALEHLAARPNVSIKISGLGQRDTPWSEATNVPVMRDAIAIFGPFRSLFASNYPVDSLVATYPTILSGFLTAIVKHSPAEQRLMLHDNAIRLYRL